MGITRQYLRFSSGPVFGVIASPVDVLFLRLHGDQTRPKFVAVAACENVIIWDSKTGEKILTLFGDKHEVSSISCDGRETCLAVGYTDGVVRIFNFQTGECEKTFSGHKGSVSCMAFDSDGAHLVTGGKDTDIILWDVINEAGVFRLHGHKGSITHLCFMKKGNILISSSKDTFVKFWDLDAQHCFKTLLGHRSEVWSFVLMKSESWLITGASDSELCIWDIEFRNDRRLPEEISSQPKRIRIDEVEDDNHENSSETLLSCTKVGTVMREGADRIYSMKIDADEKILACHGPDSLLEVFKLCTEEDLKKKLQRRQKKSKRKGLDASTEIELTLGDKIHRFPPLRASGKIRAFDVFMDHDVARVVLLLNNNSIAFYNITTTSPGDHVLSGSLKQTSHRSDVRTLCFSSDCTSILSASGESVKIWNKSSQHCIRTMPCEYALCSMFAPGDRHCIIGTKTGKLQIFDIAGGVLLEDVVRHDGAVWSVCPFPDQKGLVSGSADKNVLFWDYELVQDPSFSDSCNRLTVTHTRTLQMQEDVLCVKVSPDQRLLAVSLLDNTVKVFFMDTLKFFLSLYGHKFPVLCMDISYDNSLLVTGGADRNIKIWGLDFGDCHKSIFAHDDSVMCLQFLPKTHMIFTGGKDKKLKQWDADKFNKVLSLDGHQGAIWALAVSPDGRHVVTASHDKSIRLWQRTQEPLILEEEQEMERAAEYEEGALGEEPVISGEKTNPEAGLAGKKTLETVASTDRLMEAIDVCKEEQDKFKLSATKPVPHPLVTAYNTTCPFRFMLEVIRKIKSSELEKALLLLPYSYVVDTILIFKEFLDRSWDVELSCRCLFFLLKVHCNRIASTQSLLPVIDKLKSLCTERIQGARDVIGFNLAGLQVVQRDIDSRDEVALFTDASHRFKEKRKKKSRHILVR